MWIRSQNKECLVQINSTIELKHDDHKTIIANVIPDFTDNYDGYYSILGTYESKERALEVLGEIEDLLVVRYAMRFYGDNPFLFKGYSQDELEETFRKMTIFEMPEN